MTHALSGRCLCSAVRYRCGPPLEPPTLCHCESCRRASAAAAVGWLSVHAGTLIFTAGAPAVFESSPGVLRTFCGRCGTPLTYRNAKRPAEIDITICSLDRPEAAAPADHVWMEDALAWDRPGEGLPRHPRGRAAGPQAGGY